MTLPEELYAIESYAFYNDAELREITFPDSLRIVDVAFGGCPQLEEKENGLTYVGPILIGSDDSLTQEVAVRDGTKVIAKFGIWAGSANVQKLILPEGLKSICDWISAPNITELIVPESVDYLASGVFSRMDSLVKLTMPCVTSDVYAPGRLKELIISGDGDGFCGLGYEQNTTSTIERLVFLGNVSRIENWSCSGWPLKEVILPQGLQEIGDRAFSGCNDLETLVCPDTVTGIGEEAFWNCTNLQSVHLSESLTRLGNSAFGYCTALKKLELPDSLQEIPDGAFMGCNAMETVTFGGQLTSIGRAAFADCFQIKSIILPETVETVGSGAWNNCNALEYLRMPVVNKDEKGTFGGTRLGDLFGGFSVWGDCNMPESLKTVELIGMADTLPTTFFGGCKYIEHITLPETICKIENMAFDGCRKLKELVLPSNLQTVGMYAFRGCANIERLEFPEGVYEIGSKALEGMSALKELVLPTTVQLNSYESAYWGLDTCNLETVVLPYIGYSKTEPTTLANILGYGALSRLKQVVLLESCDEVAENAFDSISDITIYCYADPDSSLWSGGWNNGNRVVYNGNWNYILYRVDESVVASFTHGVGDAVKLPAKALREKKTVNGVSYVFIGWDINGDGKTDDLVSANLRGLIGADAVYESYSEQQRSTATVENAETTESGSLRMNAETGALNVGQATVQIPPEQLALA